MINNWRLKIFAKIVFSRLPVNYELWKRIAIFRHGDMDNPEYAYNVFHKHYDRWLSSNKKISNITLLELGPGDSISTAIIAKAFGIKTTILVDAVNSAERELASYKLLNDYLLDLGLSVLDITGIHDFNELLSVCDAEYHTNGIQSLRQLKSGSIDFIMSQAVFEHICCSELEDYMNELYRILSPQGLMSHRIDYKDHLGGELNNLRFSSKLWESDLFKKSGFYTNRIRPSEMLSAFQTAGFNYQIIHQDKWSTSPIKRNHLSQEFKELSNDDLCISGQDILLNK